MAKLYIVASPIGNLKDLTYRAKETLEKVSVIACEDTRVTRKLLAAYEIKNKKLISHHNFNERKSAPGIISLIEAGQDVALVSDAGSPLVADPGFNLIKNALAAKVAIEVIPGVSAILPTLTLANFQNTFTFLGFLKPKKGQRINQLTNLGAGLYIIFVSPHQLLATLDDINKVFGDQAQIFLGRELTKKFETHYRGTAGVIKKQLIDNNEVKGEFTLALNVLKKPKKEQND